MHKAIAIIAMNGIKLSQQYHCTNNTAMLLCKDLSLSLA